ncbi:MFS general substrate transporter [Panus rudis PR-1116 ss-1]|nr:MFS general substrate transporter [Panus rudis PR-1116 ss-1]
MSTNTDGHSSTEKLSTKEDGVPTVTVNSVEIGSEGSLLQHLNERKVLAKIDLRLVPVITAVYLLTFLDRVNIGNAALFGLKEDLNLKGNEYNAALVIFFVPFTIFEVPSNVLLKKFKPHVWLSLGLFSFGVVTVLQGLTQNYSGILATRFFLGLLEAGILPGCVYLISMWYRRSEAQKRYSFFFASCNLAGAFGGLLASAIGNLDGVRGFRGWRWVFILEGLLTCVCAVVFFFLIVDFPEDANWLTPGEKIFVQARLKEDVGRSGINDRMSYGHVWKVLKDYKTILSGFMYLGITGAGYSLYYFSPTIIQALGISTPLRTQLLSVPPYALGFAYSMFIAALSDRFAHRFCFILLSACMTLTGFGILLAVHDRPKLEYAALHLAATGAFCVVPMISCWVAMNGLSPSLSSS